MLKFKVNNQSIERIDEFEVVADSCNYLKAQFEFSEEWTEDVIAVFCHDNEYYKVLLENGCCIVPWEVIKTPDFSVALVCGNRITTDAVTVDVKKSGFPAFKWGEPPSPDIYEQILNKTKLPYIGENGNWFQWDSDAEAYADTGFNAEATDGYTPQRGIDYWTEADKKELNNYIDTRINSTVATALEGEY